MTGTLRTVENYHYLEVVAKAMYLDTIMHLLGTQTMQETVATIKEMVGSPVGDNTERTFYLSEPLKEIIHEI